MDKPDVDFIEGLCPAVTIDQKSTSKNPRSTVGTITEVYDYLRLLFARAGGPTARLRRPDRAADPAADRRPGAELEEGRRFQVLAPVIRAARASTSSCSASSSRRASPGSVSTARPTPLDEPSRSSKSRESTTSRSWWTGSLQGGLQAAADRLRRDRTASRRRPRGPRLRGPRPQGAPGGRCSSRRGWPVPTTTPLDRRAEPGPSRSTPRSAPAPMPRSRHPHGGRPRAGHSRPAGHPWRGRDRALVRPMSPTSSSG